MKKLIIGFILGSIIFGGTTYATRLEQPPLFYDLTNPNEIANLNILLQQIQQILNGRYVEIGNGNANIDYTLTFDGETNDGIITWMEDEDYFKFNDDLKPEARLLLPMGEINYFNTTGTAISIASQSDGSTNMVKVGPTTTLNNDLEFDNGGSNNGRLRYTGTTTKTFHIACTFSISPAGAADTFVVGIAKNGTVITSSKILYRMINAGDTRSSALHVMTSLATNDYLEMYIGNTTDADDVTIKTLTLFAMGM